MVTNRFANNELFPYTLLEDQVTWPMPVALELEEKVWQWPMSLTVQPRTTLPGLFLVIEKYNRLMALNGHKVQPQKLLTTTNSVTLIPWLLPYRTVGVYTNGVLITFADITRLKQTEEKLRQNQQQLEVLNEGLKEVVAERTEQVRKLVSEVLMTEQKMQQALSQLLHDELQQILVGIQIQTKMLNNALPASEPALLDKVQEISKRVDEAFKVTRRVAVDLTPPLLLHQNFIESLGFLAALMNERYGLKVGLKGELRPNWPGEEVCNLLFQVVRELLFNVVKHAEVNQAMIEISAEDCRLRVEVSDRGQGFDVATSMIEGRQHGSLGLVNIRKRLALFGGQFHIESQVGQGTRVVIELLVSGWS